jgi:hypothetical protein
MKQDAALAAIPTLGFASHVQTDVINAAREAGVGEVLARSAFTQQLADILKRQAGRPALRRQSDDTSRGVPRAAANCAVRAADAARSLVVAV